MWIQYVMNPQEIQWNDSERFTAQSSQSTERHEQMSWIKYILLYNVVHGGEYGFYLSNFVSLLLNDIY
jgi:hypothetical protein